MQSTERVATNNKHIMSWYIALQCLAQRVEYETRLKMVSYVTVFNPRSLSERDSNLTEILYNINNQVKGRSLTCQCRRRRGVEMQLYPYLTSAVDWGGGQRHGLATLTPRKGHDNHGTRD